MKYLIIVTRRQQVPVPLDAVPGILTAQRDWIGERIADGTIDVAYAFPQGGGVAIGNADSAEELSAAHVDRKVAALAKYASQQHRRYADPEYIRNLARLHGTNVSRGYAECFQVYRIVT